MEKEIYFKPKEVVKYQEDIGSNIMMPLDICLPKGSSEKKLIYQKILKNF